MSRLGKMALDNARGQWGDGWAMLSPAIQRELALAQAARIVLMQAMEKYAPAKELLQEIYQHTVSEVGDE